MLLTHEHRDHLDLKALNPLRTEKTVVILTETCAKQVEGGMVMKNGDVKMMEGLKIEAVPAYNLVHKRDNGQPFHPYAEEAVSTRWSHPLGHSGKGNGG